MILWLSVYVCISLNSYDKLVEILAGTEQNVAVSRGAETIKDQSMQECNLRVF